LAQETAIVVAPTRGCSSKQPVTEIREDGALSMLKFSSITDDRLRNAESAGDVAETALGIAFVATALQRRVPRVTPTHDAVGLADCYVDLRSLRRKAQNPVSVAPQNSIDLDDAGRGETGSELRLFQSDVHIGFPGDVSGMTENVGLECHKAGATVGRPSDHICADSEAVAAGPEKTAEARSVAMIAEGDSVTLFSIAMSGLEAYGGTTGAPTVPGKIATPVHELSDAAVVKQPSVLLETIPTPAPNVTIPGSVEEKAAMKVKYDCKQKMLREIAASQLLQELHCFLVLRPTQIC